MEKYMIFGRDKELPQIHKAIAEDGDTFCQVAY